MSSNLQANRPSPGGGASTNSGSRNLITNSTNSSQRPIRISASAPNDEDTNAGPGSQQQNNDGSTSTVNLQHSQQGLVLIDRRDDITPQAVYNSSSSATAIDSATSATSSQQLVVTPHHQIEFGEAERADYTCDLNHPMSQGPFRRSEIPDAPCPITMPTGPRPERGFSDFSYEAPRNQAGNTSAGNTGMPNSPMTMTPSSNLHRNIAADVASPGGGHYMTTDAGDTPTGRFGMANLVGGQYGGHGTESHNTIQSSQQTAGGAPGHMSLSIMNSNPVTNSGSTHQSSQNVDQSNTMSVAQQSYVTTSGYTSAIGNSNPITSTGNGHVGRGNNPLLSSTDGDQMYSAIQTAQNSALNSQTNTGGGIRLRNSNSTGGGGISTTNSTRGKLSNSQLGGSQGPKSLAERLVERANAERIAEENTTIVDFSRILKFLSSGKFLAKSSILKRKSSKKRPKNSKFPALKNLKNLHFRKMPV